MFFSKASINGVYILEPEFHNDNRGFFARTWCKNEVENIGLNSKIVQSSISYNYKKGTIRGLHYQRSPYEEVKIVSCIQGAIWDVIIDLRKNSLTFGKWISVELSSENYRMVYIPTGFAHGFQTLKDKTKVFYQISEFYHPEVAQGIRWNDPLFKINWPMACTEISKKDMSYRNFKG